MALYPPLSAVLLTAALMSGNVQAATPAGLSFAIFMDKDPIGHESYAFSQEGDRTLVAVETQTNVKMLFLTFRYHHQRQESWQGGRVTQLSAQTDDDGSPHHIDAVDDGRSVQLTADGKIQSLPEGSLPLSLWSKAVLTAPVLFGIIDAQPYHVTVQDLGPETLTVGGKAVGTEHYRISGDLQRELWYGADDLLVKASFDRRGYPITFIRD